MRKTYKIVGLDCAVCALTLQKYLEKVDNVNYCNINFSTSELILDIDDDKFKSTMKEIYKLSKQVNPDVSIKDNDNGDEKVDLMHIILYVIGIILGVVVIFVNMNIYLMYSLLVVSLLCMGYKTYLKAILQLRSFLINENTLITISIIGAVAINENMEGLMVIALYTLGKMLESKAVNYSRKSIAGLIASQPISATIITDEGEKIVEPTSVKIGDILIVRPGEKVALDGVVIDGIGSVDKKHLTGESLPISVNLNDEIESGTIVLDSPLKIKVTKLYNDGAVAKIVSMVNSASSNKSKTETFVSKFASIYTISVIILSIIVFGISWLVLKDVSVSIYRGLVFLVVSCPCAFAISVPLTYFSGIGKCSKNGILIKGSNFIDACTKLNTVVFDKTGTLTTGQFVVSKVKTIINKKEFLKIVCAGERNSIHPIAKAIVDKYGKAQKVETTNYVEIAGKGIEYKIKKDKYFVGRGTEENGFTAVVVLKNDKYLGKLFLCDNVKAEAIETVEQLKDMNIKSIMLTGDNVAVAKNVAESLNIDEYDGELLPEDKYNKVEELCAFGNVAFVGDGINDAPSLNLASVGISMGIMGSSETIESSDVVIADDSLNKIPKLIKISKFTKRIALSNIIFAGIIKLTFLILGALGITGMAFAVFADVGVTILAILNSLRVLSHKVD